MERLAFCFFAALFVAFIIGLSAPADAEQKQTPYISEDFDQKGLFYAGSAGGVEYKYTDKGAYKINAMSAKSIGRSIVADKISDFEMAVDVRLLDFDDEAMSASAGILFRVAAGSGNKYSYYTFSIDNFTKFHAGKLTGDKYTQFYPGQESTAITTGWNRLKARCIGSQIILYINNEQVSVINDATMASGGYGFYATPGASAEFDNFDLQLISSNTVVEQVETIKLPEYRFTKIVSDDFSGTNPLFYEGEDEYSKFKYTDHKSYLVDLSASDWPTPSTIKGDMTDGRVSVDSFFTSAPKPASNHVGVVIRYRNREDGWGDYYVLQVYASGSYKFVRVIGEELVDLVKSTSTDAIKKNGINRLQVTAEGSKFYIVINDIPLAMVEDNVIDRGGYGVFLSGRSSAEFQNFLVEGIKGLTDTTGMIKPQPDNFIDLSMKVNDYFTDSFDEGTEGKFKIGEKKTFTLSRLDGQYIIDAKEADEDAFSFVAGRYNRYDISVKVKKLDGEDKLGIGLVVQVSPSQTSYLAFIITNDGYYSVQQSDKGEVIKLVDWTKTELVIANDFNTLEIRRVVDDYVFKLNGEIVEMFPIEDSGAGGIAFVTAKGVKAAFDDFVIKSPE